ncbi:hypothetical protein [Paenibacillus hubeiensis]|uniref:hypothetical protein n=1 Tax=Paenibacillus hubeiensis TaxID=3077330 RepID=UPI0031BB65D4
MNFRDQMRLDVQKTFLNPNEFSELHWWHPNADDTSRRYQVNMIVELFTLDGRPVSHAEGISSNTAVVHVDLQALGYLPVLGQAVYLDGLYYVVDGVDNTFGMLKLTLKRAYTS